LYKGYCSELIFISDLLFYSSFIYYASIIAYFIFSGTSSTIIIPDLAYFLKSYLIPMCSNKFLRI